MSIYIQVAHILKDRIRAAVFYEMRINIQIIILPYIHQGVPHLPVASTLIISNMRYWGGVRHLYRIIPIVHKYLTRINYIVPFFFYCNKASYMNRWCEKYRGCSLILRDRIITTESFFKPTSSFITIIMANSFTRPFKQNFWFRNIITNGGFSMRDILQLI